MIKPLYIIGIDAEIQNRVGNTEYGDYFAIFNFLFLFQWILDPGIQNNNSQSISKNRTKLHTIFRHTASTKLLTSLLFVVFASIFAILMYGVEYRHTIILTALAMTLLSINLYLRSHFSAMGYFIHDTVLSFLDKVMLILVLGYVLYFSNSQVSILTFLTYQCSVLACVMCILSISLSVKFNALRLEFNWNATMQLIKESFPFALVFILMALFHKIDAIMLKQLVDDKAVSAGIYAAGYRIFDGLNVLGYLFASLLLPMFANLLQSKESLNPLFQESSKALLYISGVITIVFIFYRVEIINFIYDNPTDEHYAVLYWLMLSFFAFSYTYILGAMLTASSKLKALNWIFVFAIIINWSLNLWLIPEYFSVGAAIATFLTQCAVFIAMLFLCFSRFNVSVDLMAVFKYLLLIVLLVLGIHFGKPLSSFHFSIDIILVGIISMAYILSVQFLRLDTILKSSK